MTCPLCGKSAADIEAEGGAPLACCIEAKQQERGHPLALVDAVATIMVEVPVSAIQPLILALEDAEMLAIRRGLLGPTRRARRDG